MVCIDETVLIEKRIDRVLTQFRESPKLLHVMRTYLSQVANIYSTICDMPSYFNLFTATGDQLTLLGKRMGFPRCHCVCDIQPVFGFPCEPGPDDRPLVGFCEESSWIDCGNDGISEICISDDELYRKLLISRSYQMQSRYSFADLTSAIQVIYGDDARILDTGLGEVTIGPMRELTEAEIALLQVVPRVLPIAPGIVTRWHFGLMPIFGFGEGWGGFCEEWEPDGLIITTGDGTELETDDDELLITGPLTKDAEWLCRIDLKPYSC